LFPSFGFLRRPSESFTSGGRTPFLKEAQEDALPEGSARGSRRKQLVSVLRLPSASFGKLHLWREDALSERSSGGRPSFGRTPFLKEAQEDALPEGSARGSTCFEKSASFGFLPKEGRPSHPSASFGKLHLWRGGGFPKEAEGCELVLKKARPSAF